MTDFTPDPNAAGLPGQNLPTATLPIAPALPQDQDTSAPPAPGTFAGKLASAVNSLTLASPNPAAPGAWARALVGAQIHALNPNSVVPAQPGAQPQQTAQPQAQPSRAAQIAGGVGKVVQGGLTALGDAASATEKVPPGGGYLTGIARTLNARNERMTAEESNKLLRAESAARTIQIQRNIYRQDRDDRLASYQQTAKMIDAMRSSHDVQDNISQSQLNQMFKTNPKYFDTHGGGATGEEPVFDSNGKQMVDSKGTPVFSPIYCLVEIRPLDGGDGKLEVTQAESDYFKRNIGVNLPPGTMLNPDQFIYVSKKAHGVQDVTDQIQKANDGQLSAENLRQLSVELQDPSVQRYSMMVPGQPLAGLYQANQNASDHIAALNKQIAASQQNPQAVQTLQQQRQKFTEEQAKINNVITMGFNDQAKEKYSQYLTEQEKQAETERHNRADELNKATELKQKNQQNIVSNLTGEDYLQTLPSAQQGIVRAVGEGRQNLPANRKEALALLEQVHQAYPDFDESKVKTWQKANNEYRGSGKTATQVIPAYNTALEHMRDLFDSTSVEGVFNPNSKSYQDRQVALGYVTREVGKAVSAGVMTQSESKELLDKLSGGLTPALKRERISETAQLLHDKIDEYQNKFNDAAPSSAVKVPSLMSPKAAQSYDFITGRAQQPNGGQVQPTAPQIPAGARPVIQNGTTIGYTTDGKNMIPVGAR
jgi:hypothetical protein